MQKQRYRLFRRKNGTYYSFENGTGRQISLFTKDRGEATGLLAAKNQATAQPILNVAMAKVYLSAKSPELLTRTWGELIEVMMKGYIGATAVRWGKFRRSAPMRMLENLPIYQTEATQLLAVLDHKKAGVSTNVWLRILHNRALDLGWLLAPVIPKRAWPKIKYGQRRGVTAEEHEKIVASERMPDYSLFFQLVWETGGSQSDVAHLNAEDVNWTTRRLYYSRRKLATKGGGQAAPQSSPPSIQIDLPYEVVFYRKGVASALIFENSSKLAESTISKLQSFIPRVELIKPSEKIEDSVTASQLAPTQNDFMRGIFFYGGLEPDNLQGLFSQDDQTMRKLENASQLLASTLKQSWSQGEELGFMLRHNSKTDTIELRVTDPAVKGRFVRASHRSSGFTAFFAIKTILHARQQTHHADSYIYLFDEPGLYLHPSGQFDLLQVLETLGAQDQVLYVTHSLFLINKSHPTRHRLISKTSDGTVIDGKPYVGHWGVVLSALGLSLFGTILFSNEILLTEGDSDPIYVQACFQRLIAEEKLKIEINGFSAMGTGDGKNARVMLWTLSEAHPAPKIMMLFDGDEGGKEREAESHSLLESLGGTSLILDDGLVAAQLLKDGQATHHNLKIFPQGTGDIDAYEHPVWRRPSDEVWKQINESPHNADCLALAAASLGQLAFLKRPKSLRGKYHRDTRPMRESSRVIYWKAIEGMNKQTAHYWLKRRNPDYKKAFLWLGALLKNHGLKDRPRRGGATLIRDDLGDYLNGERITHSPSSEPRFLPSLA